MRFIYFFLVVAVAIVASFFFLNTYIYEQKQSETPEGEGREVVQQPALSGRVWVWEEAVYNDGSRIAPRNVEAFTLSFTQDGSFSLTTDCNTGFGTYVADENQLAFGSIGLTKKFCEGSQEQEFVGVFEHVSGYHFGPGGQLILDLKFDSGSVVFR